MKNDDYQLEELENAAVNKSNNAKRAAMIAAGAVGTAATTAAATHAYDNHISNPEYEDVESLSTEELENVAKSAANQVHEPEVKPETENNNAGQRPVTPKTDTDDANLSFNRTTDIYDADGNLVSTTVDGQVEGRDFRLIDLDADKMADYIALDVNGDGVYQDDEIVELTGSDKIDMHVNTRFHNNVVLNDEPEPYNPDKGDIAYNPEENLYNDEKNDEIYRPEDGNENAENSYAYEDDYKDESDYYGGLAENDVVDDQLDDLDDNSFDLV